MNELFGLYLNWSGFEFNDTGILKFLIINIVFKQLKME